LNVTVMGCCTNRRYGLDQVGAPEAVLELNRRWGPDTIAATSRFALASAMALEGYSDDPLEEVTQLAVRGHTPVTSASRGAD
jgi:hypothetical protein